MSLVNVQRQVVCFLATQSQPLEMYFPPFRNLNLKALLDEGGSTQSPQVPQVSGQDSETPTRAQRSTVFLRATHSHDLVIKFPLAFLNLILNEVSTQVDVGVATGEAVGKPVGFAVGVATGDVMGELVGNPVGLDVGVATGVVIGEEVGVEVGCAVGVLVGAGVLVDPKEIFNVIVDPAALMFEIVTSVSIIVPP